MKKVLESCNLADFSLVSFQHLNILNVRSKARIPHNCKTAIAIIFPYYNKSAFRGNVSAYCAVADYHIVVMEQLKSIISLLEQKYPSNSFVPFVDSSPVDEVDMAVKGGLGAKGKNTLLITEKWGSFVFIGEILTDLEAETVLCGYTRCMDCGICAGQCPGGAIKQVQSDGGDNAVYIDTEHCASFISQKKQPLADEQRAILKRAETVFGCDICQKVCPHNKPLFAGGAVQDVCGGTAEKNLFSDDIFHTVTRENVAQVYKQRPFGFRGLKVLERNLEIFEE